MTEFIVIENVMALSLSFLLMV